MDVVVKKGPPNKPIPRKKFTENFLETQRRLGKVRVKERGPVTITELDSDTCEAAVVTAHWVDGADEEGRDRSS